MKLRNEEGIHQFTLWYLRLTRVGFSRILDSGYDEEADLFFIAMEQLDEDLSSVIKKNTNSSLSLQTVLNLGIDLVRYLQWVNQCIRLIDLKLYTNQAMCTET